VCETVSFRAGEMRNVSLALQRRCPDRARKASARVQKEITQGPRGVDDPMCRAADGVVEPGMEGLLLLSLLCASPAAVRSVFYGFLTSHTGE
jgi:hypothetical protein